MKVSPFGEARLNESTGRVPAEAQEGRLQRLWLRGRPHSNLRGLGNSVFSSGQGSLGGLLPDPMAAGWEQQWLLRGSRAGWVHRGWEEVGLYCEWCGVRKIRGS